jgi:hypothetical protein
MLVSGDKYEVLLYEYNGVEWELTQFLTGNDTSGDKDFGSSVSIHNEQLVVGARHDNELGNGSGSVYVFGFDGLNWTQTAKLTSSNGHVKQNFGTSVDLNGDRLLVGAPSSSQALKTGSVYYFQYQGGSWNELSQIKPSDDVTGIANYFGWEIEVKDNLAIMGALEAVYIYDFIADEWVERKKISGSEGSLFGREFSFSGDIAMFSDPWDDTVAIESGTVYVYDGVSDLIFADTFE